MKSHTVSFRASSSKMRYTIVACIFVVVLCGTSSFAQSSLDEVHVTAGSPAPPKVESRPRSGGDKPLKVDVDLVLVPVTVTDGMNRVVLGLDKSNFQIYENKHLQSVQHFSNTDEPVSVGIIFDTSGSMKTKIDRAKEAVVEFMKTANPQDEFFVIAFSDTPTELVDFTTSTEEIQNSLVLAVPRGTTALLDAIYLGIGKMRQSKYTKKALLIISDGGDNHSRYTEQDVKRLVKESDATIFAIGVYDQYFATEEERLGPSLLSEISELTGGRSFTIDNPKDLPETANKIGVELRNQYVLGYHPSGSVRDGKWHRIKVKLLPPKGLPPLQLSAKQGYYAPDE